MKKYLLLLPAVAVVLSACSMQGDETNNRTDSSPSTMEQSSSPSPSAVTTMDEKTDMTEEKGVMVGGALMTPDKDIVDNAMNSKDHTTVVTAVKTAGLVDTLKSAGPFTVFAPTNQAFNKLPAGTVDTLLKPESKATLTKILTYHVVAGAYTSSDLKDGMKLKTVQGGELTVKMDGGKWWLIDAKGNKSMITIADVISSNGVTFVVDTVLMPN